MAVTPRVCLLTGASGLLGTRFIERLASRYQVVAVHLHQPVDFASQDQYFMDPLAPDDDIAANDHPVFTLAADLSDPGECTRVVKQALATFGQVDLLVCGAGQRHWSSLLTEESSRVAAGAFAVNTLSPLWLAGELARQAWAGTVEENVERNRNVVTVASSAGVYVYPDLGQGVYAASKAALIHLGYHLASECWDIGVRVNTVVPDTFPGRAETDDVIDAIVAFDEGSETGRTTTLLGPS